MTGIDDLNLEPPRSPKLRIRGYAILARTIDKCRATINGREGNYLFDCPVDQLLFSLKKITAEQFKRKVAAEDSDLELARWLDKIGPPLTSEEIRDWSDHVEDYMPYNDPTKRDWFVHQCKKLDLNPHVTTLFDYLEAEDAASFP